MAHDMNSGYRGWSMSERAAEAYQDGERPKSKWTKSLMLEAICEQCSERGASVPEGMGKLTRAELFDRFFCRSSWHHTSMHCNETDFYSVDEEAVEEAGRIVKEVLAQRTARREHGQVRADEAPAIVKGTIAYDEWEGSRRYGRFVRHHALCLIVGNWAYTLEGKKDIRGSHIIKVERHARAPRGTASEYKRIEGRMPASIKR